jgi:hypothetical protein
MAPRMAAPAGRRAVIDGLQADVVTLALAYDIDEIAERGMIAPTGRSGCRTTARPTPAPSSSWCGRETRRACATGGPGAGSGVSVITPNPKTSGGARWNYLAAWAWALRQPGGSDATAEQALGAALPQCARAGHRRARLHHHLRPARQGDVLLAWENEAHLAFEEFGATSSRSSIRRSPSWPSRRSRWWTGTSTGAAPGPWRRPISNHLYTAGGPGAGREAFLPPAGRRRPGGRGDRFPGSGAGDRRRRFRWLGRGAAHGISTTAAASTASTGRAAEVPAASVARTAAAMAVAGALPGFGLSLGVDLPGSG